MTSIYQGILPHRRLCQAACALVATLALLTVGMVTNQDEHKLGFGVAMALVVFIGWVGRNEFQKRDLRDRRFERLIAEMRLLSELDELLQGCRSSSEASRVVSGMLPRFFPAAVGTSRCTDPRATRS